MNFQAIGSLKNHLFGNYQFRRRKIARQSLRRQRFHVRAVRGSDEGHERIAGGRMQKRNLTIPVDDYRVHFDALAGSYLLGRAAGYVDLPEMAAIDVVLIRSDDRE